MQRTKAKRQKITPRERGAAKIQRNQICPCGSGKKYKHCHGLKAMQGLQARVIQERIEQAKAQGK